MTLPFRKEFAKFRHILPGNRNADLESAGLEGVIRCIATEFRYLVDIHQAASVAFLDVLVRR